MALTDYTVIGVAPDLTEVAFSAILKAAGSPALSSAHAVYQYCAKRRVSPAFLLAMFRQESGFGLAGTATITLSWGNTRLPVHGGVTPVRLTAPQEARSGQFPVFRDWIDGGISTASRWLDYAPYAGKTTVRQIIPTWAPAGDGNSPEGYIAAVLASIENWTAKGVPPVTLSKPAVTSHPSPNRGYAGAAYKPQAIVWHISQGSGASAVNWLSNPDANASSNYVVMESGEVVELVNPENGADGAAWANGDVKKPDLSNALIAGWVKAGVNPNLRTVSIEHGGMTSNNHGGSLTPAQVAATIRLTAWLCARFGIAPDQDHILGHYQINDVDRHYCPGFSAAEWSAWVGQVAALVAGGGAVAQPIAVQPAPVDPGFPGALQPDGRTVLNGQDFGGTAVTVEWVEVGVRNAKGERFSNKWENHRVDPVNGWKVI